jgi:hypothetical protein
MAMRSAATTAWRRPADPALRHVAAARRAPFNELKAAIGSVLVPPNDDPENDPVGVNTSRRGRRNTTLIGSSIATNWRGSGRRPARMTLESGMQHVEAVTAIAIIVAVHLLAIYLVITRRQENGPR